MDRSLVVPLGHLTYPDFAFTLKERDAFLLAGSRNEDILVGLFQAGFFQLAPRGFDALGGVGIVSL